MILSLFYFCQPKTLGLQKSLMQFQLLLWLISDFLSQPTSVVMPLFTSISAKLCFPITISSLFVLYPTYLI